MAQFRDSHALPFLFDRMKTGQSFSFQKHAIRGFSGSQNGSGIPEEDWLDRMGSSAGCAVLFPRGKTRFMQGSKRQEGK